MIFIIFLFNEQLSLGLAKLFFPLIIIKLIYLVLSAIVSEKSINWVDIAQNNVSFNMKMHVHCAVLYTTTNNPLKFNEEPSC